MRRHGRALAAVAAAALLAPAGAGATATRPAIHHDPIPFPQKRKDEMRRYAVRHYGLHTYRLSNPRVIVEHLTASDTFRSAFNTFAPDVPDSELHELPGVCSHFVIDQRGVIHQLVSLGLMCRHTVGLNWTAIGIEHVGRTDAQVLRNSRQMAASLRLTRWLQRRYRISTRNVIGHNESLSSPYHHERVARLRTQTHGDWRHADMQTYRRRLRSVGSVARD
jgi:beta-N-acetylhexosaminidase